MKKKIRGLKHIVSIIIIVVLLLIPVIIIPILKNAPNPLGYVEKEEKSAFLELWNVDTFEGGSANRGGFLEKVAIEFEKQNRGIYILVKNMSLEQAKMQLENDVKPDLVSFGLGAGSLFKPYLTTVSVNDVKSDLLSGGVVDGQQLCAPWCMGGYVLCSSCGADISNLNSWIAVDKKNFFGFGGQYNIALEALAKNKSNFKLNKKLAYEKCFSQDFTQYQAYQQFVNGDFDVLLGTQRDYFRLLNRVNLGTMNCDFRFLGGYTDLVQWFSIVRGEGATEKIGQVFLDFLLSTQVQQKLKDIAMFSVSNETIYTTEQGYCDFENVLKSVNFVQNAFLTIEEINQKKQSAENNLF